MPLIVRLVVRYLTGIANNSSVATRHWRIQTTFNNLYDTTTAAGQYLLNRSAIILLMAVGRCRSRYRRCEASPTAEVAKPSIRVAEIRGGLSDRPLAFSGKFHFWWG